MCQSAADGGRRCAAHTRPGFEAALVLVTGAHGLGAVMQAQVLQMDAVVAHAGTAKGAAEVADRRDRAEHDGDVLLADFLASAQNVASTMDEVRRSVAAQVATCSPAPVAPDEGVAVWDAGTPNLDVGEHWSLAEGGTRWHEGGCGAFAIAMVERWPHLQIACEMYHDRSAESVAHAWAYDPATNTRFHIFGAQGWAPTTRPDYDPESSRVLLGQTPEDVRRLFRGFKCSEDEVYDAMNVAVEMFDPGYEPDDDEFDRNHLYFW